MKKLVSVLLTMALCLAMLAGCNTDSGGSGGGGGKTRLVIGAGPIGGAFYPIAGGIAAIINEYVDGVNVSVQVTAGGVENTRLVGMGDVDLAISSGQQAYDAVNNTGMFAGENLQLNTLGTLHSSVCQFVVLADSDITDVTQLKGKKVAIGEAGGGAEQQFKELIHALGWSDEDVNMMYLPYDQAAEQLGDGLIDASVVYSGTPASSISDLASRRGVRLLNLTEEQQQIWRDSVDPFLSTFEIVPAGTYNGMEVDIYTAVQRMEFSCSSDLDEELAYEISKALYEHLDELYTYHASAQSITRETAADVLGAPLNPGAERYFTEAGLM